MTAEIISQPRRLNDRLLSIVLLSLMGSELLWLVTRSDVVEVFAGIVLALSVLLTAPRFGIRETYLIIIVTILSLLVWFTVDGPVEVIAEGARQAAFLMSFVLLVGLIQQAAQTSRRENSPEYDEPRALNDASTGGGRGMLVVALMSSLPKSRRRTTARLASRLMLRGRLQANVAHERALPVIGGLAHLF